MAEAYIQEARPSDVPELIGLFRELAAWEKLEDRLMLTEEQLAHALFQSRVARAAIARREGRAVAMTLFYPHFAAFTGKTTLYMEQLVVSEAFRGQGIGRQMIRYLADLALREGYNRLEWPCMVDNHRALGFYAALGAKRLTDRVGMRLEREDLITLSGGGL